jgi:hypothetical protein
MPMRASNAAKPIIANAHTSEPAITRSGCGKITPANHPKIPHHPVTSQPGFSAVPLLKI